MKLLTGLYQKKIRKYKNNLFYLPRFIYIFSDCELIFELLLPIVLIMYNIYVFFKISIIFIAFFFTSRPKLYFGSFHPKLAWEIISISDKTPLVSLLIIRFLCIYFFVYIIQSIWTQFPKKADRCIFTQYTCIKMINTAYSQRVSDLFIIIWA